MTNSFYETTAKKCKEVMKTRIIEPQGTLKEIELLIKCLENGDCSPMCRTKLYQKHGTEYCEYLNIIPNVLRGR